MKKTATLACILVLMATSVTWSQSFYNFRRQRDIIASFGLGTSTYFGDLNDPGDKFDTPFNVNIGLEYFLNNHISLRSELTYFRLNGDDADSDTDGRVRRNLSFESNNGELNFVGIFNLRPNGRRFYQRPPVNVYAFAGIGVAYFNPRGEVPQNYVGGNGLNGATIPLQDAGEMVALQPLNTEGADYNRVTMVIPFGGGLRFKAGPYFNIAVEAGYRLTFTDYLDDVSTNYRDQTEFGDNYLAAAMADRRPEIGLPRLPTGNIRGDDSDNDGYMLYNIKLEFYLPTHILSTSKLERNRRRPNRPRGRLPLP
jgi:opacity protein-like surface antigen